MSGSLPYDAILWDSDGVLVDTERLYFEATRDVMQEAGATLDLETHHEFSLRQGLGAWHLVEALGYSEDEIDVMRERRDRRHDALLSRPGLGIDGALEVVERLSGRLLMAIVTSAKRGHFEQSHKDTGIVPHLEFVLTREDYTHSKPNPEPYQLGLSRIGVDRSRCLVIEDTERGVTAAKAAGLDCWVIDNALSAHASFADADAVLPSIHEVPRALGLKG